MNLGSMTVAELGRLQSRVTAELNRRSIAAKKTALKRMKQVATEEGVSFEELVSAITVTDKPKKKTRSGQSSATHAKGRRPKVAPKYFHPENRKISWSGRGRKPQWVVDWLAQNKPLADLEKRAG